ncbi:hypothetical protein PAPYR_4969 [Paratrimastix pyriformis]|uniref:Uncharacterized protein n=1 Tax=Paratrimastix pyriformis TaxID=342808 RepID=A0ABQ8UME4_9EUKA|nr:hypothetical protein PAPYR_4969 [Paratrimastix pyriformis]
MQRQRPNTTPTQPSPEPRWSPSTGTEGGTQGTPSMSSVPRQAAVPKTPVPISSPGSPGRPATGNQVPSLPRPKQQQQTASPWGKIKAPADGPAAQITPLTPQGPSTTTAAPAATPISAAEFPTLKSSGRRGGKGRGQRTPEHTASAVSTPPRHQGTIHDTNESLLSSDRSLEAPEPPQPVPSAAGAESTSTLAGSSTGTIVSTDSGSVASAETDAAAGGSVSRPYTLNLGPPTGDSALSLVIHGPDSLLQLPEFPPEKTPEEKRHAHQAALEADAGDEATDGAAEPHTPGRRPADQDREEVPAPAPDQAQPADPPKTPQANRAPSSRQPDDDQQQSAPVPPHAAEEPRGDEPASQPEADEAEAEETIAQPPASAPASTRPSHPSAVLLAQLPTPGVVTPPGSVEDLTMLGAAFQPAIQPPVGGSGLSVTLEQQAPPPSSPFAPSPVPPTSSGPAAAPIPAAPASAPAATTTSSPSSSFSSPGAGPAAAHSTLSSPPPASPASRPTDRTAPGSTPMRPSPPESSKGSPAVYPLTPAGRVAATPGRGAPATPRTRKEELTKKDAEIQRLCRENAQSHAAADRSDRERLNSERLFRQQIAQMEEAHKSRIHDAVEARLLVETELRSLRAAHASCQSREADMEAAHRAALAAAEERVAQAQAELRAHQEELDKGRAEVAQAREQLALAEQPYQPRARRPARSRIRGPGARRGGPSSGGGGEPWTYSPTGSTPGGATAEHLQEKQSQLASTCQQLQDERLQPVRDAQDSITAAQQGWQERQQGREAKALAELHESLRAKRNTLLTLHQRVGQLEEQLSTRERELAALTARHEEATAQHKQASGRVADLEAQGDRLRQAAAELQARLDAGATEGASLRSSLDDLRQTVDGLRAALAEREAALAKEAATSAELRGQLAREQNGFGVERASVSGALSEVRARLAARDEELLKATARATAAEERLAALREEHTRAESQLAVFEQRRAEDAAVHRAALATEVQRTEDLQAQSRALQAALEQAQTQARKADEAMDQQVTRLADLEQSLALARAHEEALGAEATAYKQQLDEALAAVRATKTELGGRVAELQRRAADATAAAEAASDQACGAQTSGSENVVLIQEAMERLVAMRTSCEALHKELQAETAQLNGRIQEITALIAGRDEAADLTAGEEPAPLGAAPAEGRTKKDAQKAGKAKGTGRHSATVAAVSFVLGAGVATGVAVLCTRHMPGLVNFLRGVLPT